MAAHVLRSVGAALLLVLASACSHSEDARESTPTALRTSTTTTRAEAPELRVERESGTIVFEAGAGRLERLHALDVDTWRERLLTRTPGHTPRLSPDGTLLAYTAQVPDDPDGRLDTVHLLSMVDGTDREVIAGGCPGWSRDGRSLIVSHEDRLLRVSLEGKATPIPGGGRDGCGAEIGPGRYVLWTQGPDVTLLDHGRRSGLLHRPGCGIGPVAPDRAGRRLAMTITCDGSDGLYVMDVESRELTQVLDGPSYGAAWSPAGTMLATASERDADTYQLWWTCPCEPPEPLLVLKGGPMNNPTWGPTADVGRQ